MTISSKTLDFEVTTCGWDEFLAESEIISLHCPLVEETKYLLSFDAFQKMKQRPYLINTARGEVIETAALVWALKNHLLAGAALDVTDPEPLASAHELYQFENVLITPHIGSATKEARSNMARLCAENIIRFSLGRD